MQYFKKASLFTTLLIYREITDADTIWNTFAIYFCDNLSYQLQNWSNISGDLTNLHHDYGLYLLSELLKNLGKILDQYGLPLPTYIW